MNPNQPEKFVPPTDRNRAPSTGDMLNPDELKDHLGKIRAPGIVSGAILRGETAPFSGTTAAAGISKWLVSRPLRDRSYFQSTLLRKSRILFVRAMIVVLTVIACFAVVEFVLQRCYSIQTGNWTALDPMRGWRLVPGEYSSKPPGEVNNIAITINEFGLRSHSLSAPRSNTKNIVVLGDSFVFASQTALEETFLDRLKRLLNDRVGGGWDVMNAGVPAYGTAQELLLTRELSAVHHLNADIYLLMFFTNDTLDNFCLSYGDLTPQPIRPCFACVNYHELGDWAQCIVDTRNAMASVPVAPGKVWKA